MNEETMHAILNREFHTGTGVSNCIAHMDKPFDQKPEDCRLCLSDIKNHLSLAISVNEFLNQVVDDAKKELEERK